jgi:hypothetical protein
MPDNLTLRSAITNPYDLIRLLKKVPGAVSYDGDCSVQVVLPLEGGGHIRVGITDDDVAEVQGLWFDQYGGLLGELDAHFPQVPD